MTSSSQTPPLSEVSDNPSSLTHRTFSKRFNKLIQVLRLMLWGLVLLGGVLFLIFVLKTKSELKVLKASQQEQLVTLQGKLDQANKALSDVSSQVAALETKVNSSFAEEHKNLLGDLSQEREVWALVEVGQIVRQAQQQLQFTGNITHALNVLEPLYKHFAKSNSPRLQALAKALLADISRLKILGLNFGVKEDFFALSTHLDTLIAEVDQLPLLTDPASVSKKLNSGTVADKEKGVSSKAEISTLNPNSSAFLQWLVEFKQKVLSSLRAQWSDLMRITYLPSSAPVLLSPEQTDFFRARIKLDLFEARMALWSHDRAAAQAKIIDLQTSLSRYFNQQTAAVASFQKSLIQLQSTQSALDTANAVSAFSLENTLAAVAAQSREMP